MFVSIASMVLGAFAAIGQRNIKRLMAYSSIGHMGFALVGLAAGTAEGVQGVLVYMAIYLAMTLGTFAVHPGDAARRRAWSRTSAISPGSRAPIRRMAFFLAMLLFSLAGIPPLAGFFAKFYVFLAAIKAGLYVLAVIGVLASVVGAYYYLPIVKIMYFDEPAPSFEPMPGCCRLVLGVAGLFNLLFFVYPAPLVDAATAGGEVACSDADSIPTRDAAWRGSGSSLTTRSARPTPRRWRVRAPASAGRCGSRRSARAPGAAGAAAPGCREPGNLYASLLLTDPAPPSACAATVVRRGAGAA